jgi:hypothetical protein
VEFDALDSLIDPSPRRALLEQAYQPAKGILVQRIFVEQLLPMTQRILQCLDPDLVASCHAYVQRTYGSDEFSL